MTTLGKYEILAELGTGSMGVIYRARDTVLDREVALKTFTQAGSLDPELKERFYREARFCARLHHPNIVTVFDLGEQDGTAFISMELLSGQDLRKFITEHHQLPVTEKIRIMAAVCDGLQHAHESGVIHRDIKPSNILLTRENVPKILDFGIARFPSSRLTMMGRVLGTPHYMAPEQIMGKPCDARSDVFAAGLVAFELLTYAHPFFGESIPKRIINEAPDSLRSHNPDLPQALEPLMAKALAKDPAERFQTAGEFAAGLRSVTAGAAPREQPEAAAAASVAAPVARRTVQIPANANTEYKMSEVLAALQVFDAAVERKDVAAAQTALSTIERIAEIDDVYATAAEQSRVRLTELEASAPPPPVVSPEPAVDRPAAVEPPSSAPFIDNRPQPVRASVARVVTAPAPRATEPPVAPPAPEPAAVASSDVTRFFSDVRTIVPPPAPPPAAPPPPPRHQTAPPVPKNVVRERAPVPPRPQPLPRTAPVADPAARRKTSILVAVVIAAAVVIIGGAVGAFLFMNRSAAVVPAAATAEVSAPVAHLYAAPNAVDALVTLRKGDRVNIITAPHSRDQEWTQAQYVGGKVSPVGAMRTSDLTNWTSERPDTAFTLLQAFAPATGADRSELQDYAQRVSRFLQKFPNGPQRAEAEAELARTNAALAGVRSTAVARAEQPRSAPPPPVRAPAEPAHSAPSGLNPEAAMKRATGYWEQGDYDKAERVLARVLEEKPDYTPARNLLVRVQKARQLEGGH